MHGFRRRFSILLVFLFGFFVPARAELSLLPLEERAPVSLECKSALLMEASSGQIIFETNADEKRPVASVVKIMTILMCLEAVDSGRVSLDDRVTISKNASGMGGSQVLLDTGEVQTLDILLKSTVVGSANDAAVAIAEHLYGSQELFVKQMNARAQALGMKDTVFVNCTGLPAQGQHTTARDVARMAAALFGHELYYKYAGIWMDKVDHGDGRVTDLTNTNRLIRFYDGCDGGKTGSTNEAGYCIAATARRGGMRLIAVVLGGSSGKKRFACAEKMFDHGFANYRLLTAAERGTRVRGEMPVTGGSLDSVPLALDGDLTLLMNKAEAAEIELKPNLPPSVAAPVAAGDEIGSVDILLNGRTIARIPVAAAGSVARQGFPDAWRRLWEGWMF
ncbi:MAG: D-alanyl-D-alanine carboxypeptidase family protein [Eubacteriales bacterium]|nr:D-alanyl-D-alanine carboxypeptidase [Clostridiales bacterium]MDY2768629.1 D-alanyl-D-alanine carboxypeptidase family protein [Eubacteriales bacterium]